jgi:hypothetical protein
MFPSSVRSPASSIDPFPVSPEPDPGQASAPEGRPTSGHAEGVLLARSVEPAGASPLSLAGLQACIEEAMGAAVSSGNGPPDPTFFATLRGRVEKACAKVPDVYRSAVGEPLLRALDDMGPGGFARILALDPGRQGEARLLLDVAQALLQRAEGYEGRATAAFQEVVSDLYDGFLSAEDRRGVKPPDHGAVPPLVRWGSAEAGPYTWPATLTGELDVNAAVVSLPAANARGGLLAWPALAHETAGHDVLAADDGLRDELARAVKERLLEERMGPVVADYWSERIDESAADVLGVLNMGPAAAVGLVGYFRALNGAWNGTPSLRNAGRPEDPHPADIARAYLAAETVRLLSFDGASRWADRLVAEADRDLGRIQLGDAAVTAKVARASAAVVARTIVRTRLGALEGRAFGEIQDWRNRDEEIVAGLRRQLRDGGAAGRSAAGAPAVSGKLMAGAYAAHVVAAGVYEAAGGGSSPARVMDRMVGLLAAMNERNPAWGATGRLRIA